MSIGSLGLLFPILTAAIWLAVAIYVLVLATRFVRAVEGIADAMRARAP